MSSASFSRARAAMRRACSSEVRVCSCPWNAFQQCIPGSRTVKPPFLDEPRHCGRNQPVGRVSGFEPGADVRRSGHIRVDVEEEDAVRPLEPLEHGVELVAGKAGSGDDPEPGPLEHPVRPAPLEKATELIGPNEENGIVELLRPQELDSARMRVEANVVVGEGGMRECEAILGRRRWTPKCFLAASATAT